MDKLSEIAELYAPSARTGFYLLVVYTIIMVIATIAWCVSLFLEVTRQRASKLSIKYGSADEKENKGKTGKLILQGILIAITWAVFIIIL